MELWQAFKKLTISHMLMAYTYLSSGLLVSFLMMIGMVIWPFSKSLYRKYVFFLSYAQWSQFSFVAHWWCNAKCTMYIDPEEQKKVGKDHTLVVVNHTYEMDWLMTWMIAERHGMLGNTKIYGKSILKFLPILGWTWYFTESIFLKRNWAEDQKILKKSVNELLTYPDGLWITLLFFPEGTRCTPEKFAASQKVAREKGYPEYKHMLLPRTKGFALSIKEMKGKLPTLIDITVGFPSDEPEPTFMDVIQGKQLKCAIKVKLYNVDDIPCDTEEEAAEWLRDLFKKKDEDLDVYLKTGKFEGVPVVEVARRYYDIFWYIFWMILTWIPMFQYITFVIFSASVIHQACVGMTLVLIAILVKWMIGFTSVKNASEYGKKAQ